MFTKFTVISEKLKMLKFLRIRNFCSQHYPNFIRSASTQAKSELAIDTLPKQAPQITQASGINVASIENYSPLSCISVVIKAGSRNESHENEGLVHCLRNVCCLSTRNLSSFILTRSLEKLGANLCVSSDRENVIYSLKCPRDNVDSALEILSEVVCNPAFKAHEVNGIENNLQVDLSILKTKPEALLFEALHKVAFRGGLSNSIYSPSYMVGKHTPEMLQNFVNENYTTARTSIIGLGLPHEELQENVSKLFQMNSSSSSNNKTSKFATGEVRLNTDIPTVHAAIVADGASLTNVKDVLSLHLLQCLLGEGSHASILGEAVAKYTTKPFQVSGLSVNYSDAGLFGVYVQGNPDDMRNLVKGVVSSMRELPKHLSGKTLDVAKHKLKAKLMMDRESTDDLLNALATEVSTYGKVLDTKDLLRSLEDLTSSDVSAVASKVVKSKPAMASIGRLHATPFLDELL